MFVTDGGPATVGPTYTRTNLAYPNGWSNTPSGNRTFLAMEDGDDAWPSAQAITAPSVTAADVASGAYWRWAYTVIYRLPCVVGQVLGGSLELNLMGRRTHAAATVHHAACVRLYQGATGAHAGAALEPSPVGDPMPYHASPILTNTRVTVPLADVPINEPDLFLAIDRGIYVPAGGTPGTVQGQLVRGYHPDRPDLTLGDLTGTVTMSSVDTGTSSPLHRDDLIVFTRRPVFGSEAIDPETPALGRSLHRIHLLHLLAN